MASHSQFSIFDQQLDRLMGQVYRRAGRDLDAEPEQETPLAELLQAEPRALGDYTEEERQAIMREEFAIAGRYLRRWVAWVLERGPHPRHALPRFYSAVNAMAPDLLLHMTQAEIAQIFGQVRAAESARARKLDGMLEKVSRPGASFAGGKTAEARARMSAARIKVVSRKSKRRAA
jgi:rubrerythrin